MHRRLEIGGPGVLGTGKREKKNEKEIGGYGGQRIK